MIWAASAAVSFRLLPLLSIQARIPGSLPLGNRSITVRRRLFWKCGMRQLFGDRLEPLGAGGPPWGFLTEVYELFARKASLA